MMAQLKEHSFASMPPISEHQQRETSHILCLNRMSKIRETRREDSGAQTTYSSGSSSASMRPVS